MSTRLEFEITFKSDYHVGAGHGLGPLVDSALLRDPDQVPVIRGTVLAGLLRESLANVLSLAPLQSESSYEERIFGAPSQPKRWRISSARPKELTTPQQPSQEWRAGETAAQITTRVRVNPRTRRAEENKLFTREEGDSSLCFHFVAECEYNDDETQREAELLVAAARMLRNLGAGKRRGYGECEIHLADRAQEAAILARVARRLRGESAADVAPSTSPEITPFVLPASPERHYLRVLIRLDEPLLIARRAEAGNQFETLDTIPGSVLRGTLAWRIARRFGRAWQSDSPAFQQFVRLFFDDMVRFSPLLPVEAQNHDSGYPTIVAPRDLVTCELHRGYPSENKDKGHGVWSLFNNPPSTCPECAKEDSATGRRPASVKLESLGGFISLVKGGPRSRHCPQQTVEMHIRIDAKSGRVRTGDLYGYVALEPGQYFIGEITCADATVWQALQTMADLQPDGQINELRFGKATRRGYGKVSAVFQPAEKSLFELRPIANRVTSPDQVTMLLLSDAIVTDPWGRFWRGFDPAWLQCELKLPSEASVSIEEHDGELLACSAIRTIDSFNATLGLPRTRDIAIVAGSSARLRFQGIALPDLQQILAKAEAQGIGLRRDEGFGRVAFNHPIYTNLQGIASPVCELESLALKPVDTSHPVVQTLQFALRWAQRLDEQRFDECADARFDAVARLLHASSHTAIEPIKRELEAMGKAETLLQSPLTGRDKPNFFETDGRRGMQMINALLDELAKQLRVNKLDQNPRAWQIGLQMIAARISGVVRSQTSNGGR